MITLTPTPNGFRIASEVPLPPSLDAELDGQRVWSFDPTGVDTAGAVEMHWPTSLDPFLVGTARLTLRDSRTRQVVTESEIQFSPGGDFAGVRSPDGKRLSVNKWGELDRDLASLTEEERTLLVQSARRIVDELTTLGLCPFVVGGTLLGAVRTGELLPHDDDVDIAYLSTFTVPADVAREHLALARTLEQRGYVVRRHSAAHTQILGVSTGGGFAAHIDIFASFFTPDGCINQPFHVRGDFTSREMLPLSEVYLHGVPFPAPADVDAWLTLNYDRNWRTPQPGFVLETATSTRRRFESWFGGFNFRREFWDDFHRRRIDRGEWDPGRNWLLSLVPQLPGDGAVVDLGCGRGALAHDIARARPGARVHGVDFSEEAITEARRIARQRPESAHLVTFELENLYRFDSLALFRRARLNSPCSILANHTLDQLGHHGRANALRLIRQALRSGGLAGATIFPEPAPGVTDDDPTTWHLEPAELEREARQFGLEVAYHEPVPLDQLDERAPVFVTFTLLSDRGERGEGRHDAEHHS